MCLGSSDLLSSFISVLIDLDLVSVSAPLLEQGDNMTLINDPLLYGPGAVQSFARLPALLHPDYSFRVRWDLVAFIQFLKSRNVVPRFATLNSSKVVQNLQNLLVVCVMCLCWCRLMCRLL
jgi:hypothetical protein